MTQSLISAAIPSLEAMPQNALLMNRDGNIRTNNSRWRAYCKAFSLPVQLAFFGSNYLELLPRWVMEPESILGALNAIFQGERLVVSVESTVHCMHIGRRAFRFDAFPLMGTTFAEQPHLILSHQDLGPVIESPYCKGQDPGSFLQPHTARLLPICASCKSIRNDQDEWLRIERFLQQQLTVQFTHDICPECIRQLYPQYADAFNGKVRCRDTLPIQPNLEK